MSSLRWLLASIFLILINLLAFVTARHICSNGGNYTSNSRYSANLNILLSSLSTNVDSNGFYNASVGENLDRVYATVLCRGDLQLDICRSCIQDATNDVVQACPNKTKAIVWRELCTLRYSHVSMFGILANSPSYSWGNIQNSTSPHDKFKEDVSTLLDNLRVQAVVYGSSLRKVAAGNRTTSDSKTIYALVQCSPDLYPDYCRSCLSGAIDILAINLGSVVLKPSCNLRYEILPFYNVTKLQEFVEVVPKPNPKPPPPVPISPIPLPPEGKKDDNTTTPTVIIAVVVSIVGCLLIAVCVGVLLRKRSIKKKPNQGLESEIRAVKKYGFGEIKAATNHFSDDNMLGQGGFGVVYKGKLPNGKEIAVKKLSTGSKQGDPQFKNEVLLLARLRHRNLVRLLGFSIEGNEKLLVYEFVENQSLDKFIFDPNKRSKLDWTMRYNIIVGIARGLLYLHRDSQPTIIHRDLKADNVLLDKDMNPKIADFGLAKLFESNKTHATASMVAGTCGYMPPEYVYHGQFSVKLDVFSFGVLLLEIISGKKCYSFDNEEHISHWAWNLWQQESERNTIIDPELGIGSNNLQNMLKCIHIGLLCVQVNVTDRPTMADVDSLLSGLPGILSAPSELANFGANGNGLGNINNDSKNDCSFTDLSGR